MGRDFKEIRQVLFVFAPLRIHPVWEKLILGHPLRAEELTSLPLWKKILIYPSYGQMHRANPRTALYMTDLALDFAAKNVPEARIRAWVHPALKDLITERFVGLAEILSLNETETPPTLADTDVFFLYPDSTGYGWGAIEKRFASLTPYLWVLNGRKRVFPFTPQFQTSLRWRRFLERFWVIEWGFLAACITLGIGSWIADRFRWIIPQHPPIRKSPAIVPNPEQPLQNDVREWWAGNPMTYGRVHGKTEYELGTREFFEKADETFYDWNTPLHTPEGRFGKIFNYAAYKGKDVLEIGCGMGCMAMQWAQHGVRITAADLNPVAITQTKRRFELFGLQGTIVGQDARHLDFPADHFDFVYSWGVLHHSPDLKKSLDEVYRVLKPGGRAGIMLYNRESFLYRYTIAALEGYVHMENSFLTPLELASRYTDGAREEGNPHTWPITPSEAYNDLFTSFEDVQVKILGTDIDHVIDLAFPRVGSGLFPKTVLKSLARHWGWGLWITGRKKTL